MPLRNRAFIRRAHALKAHAEEGFMAVERTFSIIKPDATRRNLTGRINARFEEKGLRIVAQRRIWMSRQQAEQFYGVHKERPFFNDLCTFMTSGPVVVQVLEGDNAIARNREIMGATNPANAAAPCCTSTTSPFATASASCSTALRRPFPTAGRSVWSAATARANRRC